MQNLHVIRLALGTVLILLAIGLVNQFSDEFDWNTGDFIIMGVLLLSAGLAYEMTAKKVSTALQRVAVAVAIGTLFLLIWAELAVGIFGSPLAGS